MPQQGVPCALRRRFAGRLAGKDEWPDHELLIQFFHELGVGGEQTIEGLASGPLVLFRNTHALRVVDQNGQHVLAGNQGGQ